MAITEAIILAGGLGTRLRSAVPDLPKCMAPVNGKPFIRYVIEDLHCQGITTIILSLGYKSEAFDSLIASLPAGITVKVCIEDEPLGTGGGIRLATSYASTPDVLVCNGDTLFKVDVPQLAAFHQSKQAHCTLTLKPLQQFERYGVVELDNNNAITSFKEKQFYESGLINGGVYALNVAQFTAEDLPAKFSFEKDYLEKHYMNRPMFGLVQDAYFIDIGIPEDYARAAIELQ